MQTNSATLDDLVLEFTARLTDLGISTIVTNTQAGPGTEGAFAIFAGSTNTALYGPFRDMEHGHQASLTDSDAQELRELCIATWPEQWPPDSSVARASTVPSRLLSNAEPLNYDLGNLTEWYSGDIVPRSAGDYLTRTDKQLRLTRFEDGAWVGTGSAPAEWRGLDKRLTPSQRLEFTKLFRSGDVDAGAMLFRDAHSRRKVSNGKVELKDTWAVRAAIYANVLNRSTRGRLLREVIERDRLLPVASEEARKEILRQADAFVAGGEL